MADHTYSGFNGAPLSHGEAQRKVQAIRETNARVGARGWTQEIVPHSSGKGYQVVEHSPNSKKKK